MLIPSMFIAAYVGVFAVSAAIAAARVYFLKDSSMLGDTFASEQELSRFAAACDRLPIAANESHKASLAA